MAMHAAADFEEPLRDSVEKPILLIDIGHLYWMAWHSTNRDAEPDAPAEYVLGQVRRLADEYPRIAICCDDPGGNWRYNLLPTYKANRGERPEGSKEQLRRLLDILERDGFLMLSAPDQEADDVIASACRVIHEAGDRVLVVTADKDLMQLVREGVGILNPKTGMRFGPAEVVAKYGVPPHQIRDWLALMGDAADNIPGIKGCGPKNAAALLSSFGDIDGVLRATEDEESDIRPAIRASLVAGAEQLGLARKLTSLVDDLPIDLSPLLSSRPANDAIRNARDAFMSSRIDEGELAEAVNAFLDTEPPPRPAPKPEPKPITKETTMANQSPESHHTNGAPPARPTPTPANGARRSVKGAPKMPHAIILTGRSGIGKTYLASTVPNVFFECVEQGLQGASKAHVDEVGRWPEQPRRFADLIRDMEEFRTSEAKLVGAKHFVIDSMTGVERLVNKQVCNQESVAHMAAKEFQTVWVAAIPLWQRIQDELDKIRAMGIHVWCIAHSSETTESVGETGETWTKFDLQFQGSGKSLASLRNMWRAWADHVLFIDWQASVQKAKAIGQKSVGKYDARILRTRETPQHYAKNRANLPPVLAASWVDLQRAMAAGSAGGGPAPDAKMRQQIADLLPKVPDDGDREGLQAETRDAKTGAQLAAILSRIQGLIAAARDDEEPEQQQTNESQVES